MARECADMQKINRHIIMPDRHHVYDRICGGSLPPPTCPRCADDLYQGPHRLNTVEHPKGKPFKVKK